MNRKGFMLAVMVVTLVFSLLQAQDVFAQAKQINFYVKIDTNYADMKNVRFGNMVSPDGACSFWSADPAGGPDWVWYNMGQGAQKFALAMNYDLMQGGNWATSTVIGTVIVNPAAIPLNSNGTINVTVKKCSLGPGNDVLAVYSVSGTGGSAGQCSITPACSNFK